MPLYKYLLPAFLLFTVNLAAQTNAADTTEDLLKIYNRVEVEASYPGGIAGWRKFLMANMDAGTPVKNNAPAGRYTVIARFIVTKDGSISDVATETNMGYGMEMEVKRILERSGKWIPASVLGRNVNAYRRQPVTFIVQDDNLEILSTAPDTLFTGKENTITVTLNRRYGVDNAPVSISVDNGTADPLGPGKFIVKVNNEGRAIISVYYGWKKKLIGKKSFTAVKKSS